MPSRSEPWDNSKAAERDEEGYLQVIFLVYLGFRQIVESIK